MKPNPSEPNTLQQFIQWEEQRRRPDGRFYYPLVGLGSPLGSGPCTMRLPPTLSSVTQCMAGGKLASKTVEALDDPRLIELRHQVLLSLKTDPPHLVVRVGTCLIEFIAAALQRNYTLTDEDMTALLLRSKDWHEPAVEYALGGESGLRRYAQVYRTAADRGYSPAGPESDEAPATPLAMEPAPDPLSLRRRLFAKIPKFWRR